MICHTLLNPPLSTKRYAAKITPGVPVKSNPRILSKIPPLKFCQVSSKKNLQGFIQTYIQEFLYFSQEFILPWNPSVIRLEIASENLQNHPGVPSKFSLGMSSDISIRSSINIPFGNSPSDFSKQFSEILLKIPA